MGEPKNNQIGSIVLKTEILSKIHVLEAEFQLLTQTTIQSLLLDIYIPRRRKEES